MPTRDEWLALAERCERAEGPGRELDMALAKAANLYVYDTFEDADGCSKTFRDAEVKSLTSSLDAAVAVVEARFGKEWALGHSGTLCFAAITNFPKRLEGSSYFNDALALMAAYCRARAEEETQ